MDCPEKEFDAFGIGSALMDFLVEMEDKELVELSLEKGSMTLISEDESKKLMKKLESYNVRTAPGGSTANTLAGIAALGGRVAFCGKVGHDLYGEVYEQKSADCGVCSRIRKHSSKATGHAITFITPDSERTFATHLGASIHLKKEDVLEEDIVKSRIFHTEGYQLEDAGLKETAMHALSLAKKNCVMVSIDLADAGLVKRNLGQMREIAREYADIVFANEKEAFAFAGMPDSGRPEDALEELSKYCKTAVVKIGAKGSLVKQGNKSFRIEPFIAKAVDTTGAGDMYAAGFLFGISRGLPVDVCGRIGSWAASKVVAQVGARLNCCLKDEVKSIIQQ